jgi:hypothetical protein
LDSRIVKFWLDFCCHLKFKFQIFEIVGEFNIFLIF